MSAETADLLWVGFRLFGQLEIRVRISPVRNTSDLL